MSTIFTPNQYLRALGAGDTSAIEAQLAALQAEITSALNDLEALALSYDNLNITVGGIGIDLSALESDLAQAKIDLTEAQTTLSAIPGQIAQAMEDVEASANFTAQELADLAEAAAIAAAAADATTKANTAKSEAIIDAVTAAALEAQSIADTARNDAIFQAEQLADLAEAAAIAAAATDAQAKADLAQQFAVSAAEAEAEAARLAAIAAADADSTAKADAAEAAAILAAEALAAAAQAAAEAAAAADATAKVNAAKIAAINDAVAQATTLANQAKSEAIAAAALTAQEKADLAEAAALAALSDAMDTTIISSVVEYAKNTSETVAPSTGWGTATPTHTQGDYIWMRTVITKGDNSSTTTNPVLLTGNTGPQGSQGIPGTPGTDGIIYYTWLKYASSATPAAGDMSDSPAGKTYMGIAVGKTSATESTNYTDYNWSLIQGPQGQQGIPGTPGADGTTTYTWVKYASSATPTAGDMSDSPTGKTYIGLAFNKTTQTESTTPGDYQWSLIQGPQGPQGPQGSQGIQGPPGADGATTYTWLKYADTPTTGMSDTPDGKTYMGLAHNKTTATESTNYADYNWSLIKGADGASGKGISTTTVTYQVHTSGTTAPTGTWLSTVPSTTTGQFLWTKTYTTYTDATNSTAYSVAAHGSTGSTGATGKGISSTAVTYQVHTNGTTAPTGEWLSTVPATTTGQFLWTRTIITYTDATTSPAAYSVAAHGATGSQGIQGPIGPNGQPTYTWIKYGTSAAGAGITDDPAGMTYIGIAYNKTTQTESSTPGDYTWSLIQGPQGPIGNTGAQGVSVTSVTPFFKMQTSATAPAAPSVIPPATGAPSGWLRTEPAYTAGNYLFRTEGVVYSNDTWAYTTVTRVSSWEIAATALASANGRNSIFTSTSPASGTTGAHPTIAGQRLVTGDIHFQVDSMVTLNVIGQWRWKRTNETTGAGVWESTMIKSEVIANLDAAKITTGTLHADRIGSDSITSAKIAAGAIVAGKLAADAVLAANIKAGEINTDHLVAGAVTAAKIAANTITAAEIATAAITADELAANSVIADKIAANAVEAGKIAAGAVVAGKIAANAVISESIAADAITAVHLDAASVTADAIASAAISAIHISADAITTDAIAASAITSAEIAADAITSDKILAGAIVAGKMAADAVLAANIKAGEIGAGHIAAESINTIHLIASAVTATQLAASAVTTDKLAANAVVADKIAANAVTADKILAGSVTAGKLETNLVLTTDVIAGNPTFSHARMNATGFKAFVPGQRESIDSWGPPVEIVSLGTGSGDILSVSDPVSQQPIAGFNQMGYLTSHGAAIDATTRDAQGKPTGGFSIYGKEFLDYEWEKPRGVVGWSKRTNHSTVSNGSPGIEQPVLQVNAMFEAGRLYRLSTGSLRVYNGVSNGVVSIKIRGVFGGAEPTTTSTIWAEGSTFVDVAGGVIIMPALEELLEPTSTSVGKFLLTVQAGNGDARVWSNTTSMQTYLVVEDIGTSGKYWGIPRDGTAPPPVSRTTYNSTWGCTATESYTGGGVARESYDSGHGLQGYASGQGDQHSMHIFGGTSWGGQALTLAQCMSQPGFTLHDAAVYLYFNHWYYGSGGTAIISRHDSLSPSGASPPNTKNYHGWARGEGRWVSVAGIWNTNGRGIALGKSGGTDPTYYGRSNGAGQANAPMFAMTYSVNA